MRAGDKVVYVMQDLPEIGLKKNQVYRIEATAECGGCTNGLHIDIGITHGRSFVYCGYCENIVNVSENYFFHHSGFRPVVESKQEQLAEAVNQYHAAYKTLIRGRNN